MSKQLSKQALKRIEDRLEPLEIFRPKKPTKASVIREMKQAIAAEHEIITDIEESSLPELARDLKTAEGPVLRKALKNTLDGHKGLAFVFQAMLDRLQSEGGAS